MRRINLVVALGFLSLIILVSYYHYMQVDSLELARSGDVYAYKEFALPLDIDDAIPMPLHNVADSLPTKAAALISTSTHSIAPTPTPAHVSVHPQCGPGIWQRQYTEFHADMLKKPLEEQRLSIMDAYRNGAGDRLTMVITAFAYSLLTNRAFKIKWAGTPLEEAVHARGFDWTYSASDDDPELGIVELKDYMTMYIGYDDFEVNKLFQGDLGSAVNSTVRSVVWRLNQGQLYNLFDNPLYRTQLYEWGLRPETAFGCFMQYLFKIRPETIQVLKDQWSAVLNVADPVEYMETEQHMRPHHRFGPSYEPRAKPHLVVGIQVRFGDAAISNGRNCENAFFENEWAGKFLPCAQTIERDLKANVLYYVLSDCESFRKAVRDSLPEGRVVTFLSPDGNTIKHIEHSKDIDVHTFRIVISEMFLFSMTDFHVMTGDSSFGKVGSMMSLKWHQVFSLDRGDPKVDVSRKCSQRNWDQFREYSHTWVRI